MVSLTVILFSTKCFLFVYMYIDLLKLKAYKLFRNRYAYLSWLLFKEANLLRYGQFTIALKLNLVRFYIDLYHRLLEKVISRKCSEFPFSYWTQLHQPTESLCNLGKKDEFMFNARWSRDLWILQMENFKAFMKKKKKKKRGTGLQFCRSIELIS